MDNPWRAAYIEPMQAEREPAAARACWTDAMTTPKNSPLPGDDGEHRVIGFRRGRPVAGAPPKEPGPVADLARYAQNREAPEDYRHRMIVNSAAFLFVVALIGAAVWLADTMADMRRNQDCVLSGRRGCTPVEVDKDRW